MPTQIQQLSYFYNLKSNQFTLLRPTTWPSSPRSTLVAPSSSLTLLGWMPPPSSIPSTPRRPPSGWKHHIRKHMKADAFWFWTVLQHKQPVGCPHNLDSTSVYWCLARRAAHLVKTCWRCKDIMDKLLKPSLTMGVIVLVGEEGRWKRRWHIFAEMFATGICFEHGFQAWEIREPIRFLLQSYKPLLNLLPKAVFEPHTAL